MLNEKISELANVQFDLDKKFNQKYENLSGVFPLFKLKLYRDIIKVRDYIKENGAYTVINVSTLNNVLVDLYEAEIELSSREHINYCFCSLLVDKFGTRNYYELLDHIAIRDEEWIKEINKTYRYEYYIKYVYTKKGEEIILNFLNECIEENKNIESDYLELIRKRDEIESEIEEIKKSVKQVVVFQERTIFTTGIVYLLKTKVSKDVFKILVDNGLHYFKEDEEAEIHFNGWAVNEHNIDKVKKRMNENGYLVELQFNIFD